VKTSWGIVFEGTTSIANQKNGIILGKPKKRGGVGKKSLVRITSIIKGCARESYKGENYM